MATRPDAEYQDFLRAGRFMIQRSTASGHYFFFPRAVEPGTAQQSLQWVEASGHGTVYTTTTVRPKPPQSPYNVCVVELAEGPRLMTRIDGIDPQQVHIGMAVTVKIDLTSDIPHVAFTPAQQQ